MTETTSTTTKTGSVSGKGAPLLAQGGALLTRVLDVQKSATLTWLDLYDKNTKVVLGAGETLADKTPVSWAADALRKQNAFAGRLTSAYSDAVRSYLA